MISKSFLKSSFIFTIGGALPMVASIILLPFYANLLGEANYTKVLFYINISLLFQVLFSFSLESYFGIEYSRLNGDPERQKRFTGTVSVMLLFIGAGLLILSALFGKYLFGLIFRENLEIDFWPYGFYSILTAFFNSYFKAATVALIYLKKAKLFLFVNVINAIATVVISIGGLKLFPETIIGPVYGRLLSGVIIFLMAHFIFTRNSRVVFDNSFLKEIVKFSTPFMIFSISGWTLAQIDKFILQEFVERADLNAYDLITKCFFGIEFVQNSLSAIIFPKLYEIWTKNGETRTTKESNRYFNVFTAINIMQLIMFCIAVPVIYELLIKRDEFHRAQAYIGLLAAGYSLRGILNFYVSTILYTKRITVLLKIFGSSALIQVALSYFAVKYFGIMGAIYAILFVRIIQVPLSTFFTRGVFVYEFNKFKLMLIPFLYIGVNVIQFYFHPEFSYGLYAAQLVFFSALFFMIFRNEIAIVSKQFLSRKA